MLRASQVLLAPFVKKTTGLVGLAVVPNAREVLVRLYEKTLNDVKIIPETAEYRKAVEKFTNYRLDVVKQNEDILEIENKIACGQVEELIEQAKNELILIPQMAEWKVWEQPRPSPDDDDYQHIYDELEFVDPDSVQYLGLRDLALKKRAEAESRRKAAAARAAPATPAAAAAPKQ